MKIGILNDFTSEQYVGGTELFCDNMVRLASKHDCEAVLITPLNYTDDLVSSCDCLLVTNVAKFSLEAIEKIKTLKYYKLEMDYGYCKTRNGLCQMCDSYQEGRCNHNLKGYYDLLSKAQKILFLNPFQREFYKRDFGSLMNNSMSILIFMGELDAFKDYGEVREKGSFLFTGRFFFEKGIDRVLVMALQYPHSNFYFVGWGDPKYVMMINNLKNCHYLGMKTIQEMPRIYNNYENFISLPVWFDTGAITLVEAELCGMKIYSNENNKVQTHCWKDKEELRRMIQESETKLFDLLKDDSRGEINDGR